MSEDETMGVVAILGIGWIAVVNLVGLGLVLALTPKGHNRFGRPGATRGALDAIQSCLGHYSAAGGRASRSEFWWFFLAYFLIVVALTGLDSVLHTSIFRYGTYGFLLPVLTAQIRRLHDINRSGWWVLLNVAVIPVTLWLLCARRPVQDDAQAAAEAF